MTSPLDLDITALGKRIRQREVAVSDIVAESLRRARMWQPAINAFIDIRADDAMQRAQGLDRELAQGRWRGPLHGIPMAHKDMFYRAGHTSTCGSVILQDWKASQTSTVLQRLDDAGAVDIGTLNMSEFAAGPTGHNAHFGHCRNPWDPSRVSGGSSSGSGAAVAARIVHASIGSDTGGSIRIPASICGTVGLKPTYGVVSRHAAMPRSWTLDCFGPLTRTVVDNWLVLQALCGIDPADPTSVAHRFDAPDDAGSLQRLVIGIDRGFFLEDTSPGIAAAFAEAIRILKSCGAETAEMVVPDPASFYGLSEIVSKCEAAAYHEEWMQKYPDRYTPQVKSRVESAFYLSAVKYINALRLRGPVMRKFCDEVFSACDVLLTPTLPCPTPEVEGSDVQDTDRVPDLVWDFSRNTRPFNYLGLPACSVPAPVAEGALPCGIQVVGRPFSEALLYRVSRAIERNAGWETRSPPPPRA